MVGRKIPDVAEILKLLEILVVRRERIYMRERHNLATAHLDPSHMSLPVPQADNCDQDGKMPDVEPAVVHTVTQVVYSIAFSNFIV